MKRWMLGWIVTLAGGPVVLAQETGFAPAQELEAFDRLLGSWEGTGKVWGSADTEPLPWTSTSEVERILGGHVFQENMRVEFGPAIPALHFRTFTGWDEAADRPLVYGVSNMGPGTRYDVRWIDEDTMVSTAARFDAGVPVVERSVMTFVEGGYHLRVDEAKGAEPFMLTVEGDMRRVEKARDGSGEVPSAYFSPTGKVPEGLAKLAPFARMVGSYRLKGEVEPMPGAAKMAITGSEDVELMYGGTLLVYHGRGDPMDGFAWEGYGYQWWDPERNCFIMLHLDNMGGMNTADVYATGDRIMISTASALYMGQPTVHRTAIGLDEKGRIATVRSHTISGTAEPSVSFSGSYTFVEEEAAAVPAAYRPGSCCDKAQKAGKACEHPCCVAAAKQGKVCESCN